MDLRCNEETVIANCGDCGKEYETMRHSMIFAGELYETRCWVCRLCSRIDAVMYHFGIDR